MTLLLQEVNIDKIIFQTSENKIFALFKAKMKKILLMPEMEMS